ncbi:MAG: RHS repeat-associated core domain-containing protein [Candidatus Aenigmatarchaeota archaeon]
MPLQMIDKRQNNKCYYFRKYFRKYGKTELNLKFSSQYKAKSINLYYNWHRYYSPKIGKYFSKDPIVWKIGGYLDEFYNYSLNNPIINYDIKGEAVRTKLCTASQNAKIQQAAQKADAASQKCLPCEDRPKFRMAIRSMGTKKEITLYCVGEQKNPKSKYDLCGYTTADGNIAITDYGLYDPDCGCLEATIIHEFLHLIGYNENEAIKAERRCFKCSSN